MARTSGTDSATTMPVRQPSDRKLTTNTIASASPKLLTNSDTDSSTICGWSAIWVTSMPTGSSAMMDFIACFRFSPSVMMLAPSCHRDAEPERRLAAFAHDEGRRVLVAALDRGDVAEPEHTAVRLHRHGGDGLGAGEGAGDPHIDAVGRGIDRSAGDHGVLLGDAVEDLLGRDAERGELCVAELDEDLLRALADDIDLVDVGNAQQGLADVLGARLELGEAQAVRRQHVDDGIDVAVFVVEIGADDAGRQIAPDVADLLAHLVPKVLDLGGRSSVREKDLDEGNARLRIALHAVEVWQVLQLLLDLVGDLRLHFRSRRAGPGDVHDHRLDREGRILGTAEVEVGVGPGRAEQQDHEQDERLMRDRPFRKIEALHDPAPPGRGSRKEHGHPLALIDGADSFAGVELLHAELHDAVAVADAGGDQRRVLGEGRDLHRSQLERTGRVDHIDRWAGPTVEDRRERQLRHRDIGGVRERHRRRHAERDGVVGIVDGEARGVGAGRGIGLRRQLAQAGR